MDSRVKMFAKLVLLFLLLQLLQAEPTKLQCKLQRSKICQLDSLTWKGAQIPELPDLSLKHTLIIRSGSITDFSKELTSKLGSVTKLQLGQLEIRSLYISPKWTSLKADSNQIYELVVEELEAEKTAGTDQSKETEDATVVPLTGSVEAATSENELRFLNLVNNRLKSAIKLKYLFNLEELLLDGNLLEFIEMDAFRGMKKLKKLSLTHNKINHITTNGQTNLPALERLSLAFNQLTKLEVKSWTMLQMVHLDVSHNQLVQMDVPTLSQFVSLERLSIGNNSWHCEWLGKAVKDTGRHFVQLLDAKETCPKDQFELEGYCCSYTHHVEDEPISVPDRIARIEAGKSWLKKDITEKVTAYKTQWTNEWDALHQQAKNKMKPYKELEDRMHKDDNRQAKDAVNKFTALLEECDKLLEDIRKVHNENRQYAQKFTNLFYTSLAEKNKLLQEMAKAAKLEEDMKKYEVSFKTNNGN